MVENRHPVVDRLLRSPGYEQAWTALGQASGSDLSSLLLGAFADRVRDRTPADLVAQYQSDRFVGAAQADALELARLHVRALELASTRYQAVALAPVVPLGTHAVLGDIPQNNVVSTIRMTEVTADPTNSLAFEAAARRSDLMAMEARSSEAVHLVAAHRVLRAQHFEGPRSFAHFSLLGLVSAGRDQGNYRFEIESVLEHLRVLVAIVESATAAPIRIRLSAFDEVLGAGCDEIAAALVSDTTSCELWPDREHARGYYNSIAFNLSVKLGDEVFDIGDGGDVDWTQTLLQSRKERLVIGGLGLERLAMLVAEQS